MTAVPPTIEDLIARAGQLASDVATTNAGTPGTLFFDTIERNIDRLVAALPDGPSEALPIATALSRSWGPKDEPPPGSDEASLAELLSNLRSEILAWRVAQPPPPGVTYFPIDRSRPTPRGPGISYECMICGDVIASVEEAKGPSHCGCYAIVLRSDMQRASFRDRRNARGVRVASLPPKDLGR